MASAAKQISLPAENGSGQLGCTASSIGLGGVGLGPIQINSPAETTSSMMAAVTHTLNG